MTILLVDNTDSFTYNLYQMLQAQTDEPVRVARHHALTIDDVRTLGPSRIVLSPGPGHPGRREDFGVCQDILAQHEALACPILGVCLGHQGLALHFGASLAPMETVVHGKTASVTLLGESALFAGIESPMRVMRYHSWAVPMESLPACLKPTALTDDKNGEPVLMALEHVEKPLYGVQFHPESIGTPEGSRLLKNFLALKTGFQGEPVPLGGA